jgi:hypothetical protein
MKSMWVKSYFKLHVCVVKSQVILQLHVCVVKSQVILHVNNFREM